MVGWVSPPFPVDLDVVGWFPPSYREDFHIFNTIRDWLRYQHVLCARLASFIGLVCILFIILNDHDHLQLPLSQYSILSIITTTL